jgi:hypothetical protein
LRTVRNARNLTLSGLAIVLLLAGLAACQKNGVVVQKQHVESTAQPMSVPVQQVHDWIDEGERLVVLDSRSAGAWQYAPTKARGAIRVPPHDVLPHLESIPTDQRIIVYCT